MAMDADQLRRRATEMMSQFGPAQMAAMGLLAVITIIGGLWFVRWAATPDYQVLFSGLEPSDAAEVTSELDSSGVPYKLGSDGTTVLVPSGQVHQVRLDMSAQGLPAGGTVGFEIFDKQGLTTSEFRQRVDYQRALEGELTRTLMELDGISSVSVHLAIPQDRLFQEQQDDTRASVLVQTRAGGIGDSTVQSIVHLVSSSVPGLDPDGVTVADVNGRVLSNGSDAGTMTNRQLALTRQYEQQLSNDASLMLASVLGPRRAVVRVSAQLNFDESEQETEVFDPTNATAVREQSETESFTGPAAAAEGPLGIDGSPIDTGADSDTTYERTEVSTETAIDRTVTRSKVAPGRVERLSVAVILDATADPSPNLDTVESVVGAALGVDPNRGDIIVVDSIEFDTELAEAADDAVAAAESAASTDMLLGYARTGVGALVLLLVSFFLIRGARRTTVEEVDLTDSGLADAIAAAQASGELGQTPAGLPAGAPALAAAGAGSYDSQVMGLIDQQPEEVAQLLRGWLADRRG